MEGETAMKRNNFPETMRSRFMFKTAIKTNTTFILYNYGQLLHPPI